MYVFKRIAVDKYTKPGDSPTILNLHFNINYT